MELVHEHIFLLLKTKFDMSEVTIIGDDESFTATDNNGVTKTQDDFTAKELSDTRAAILKKRQTDENNKKTAKEALLTKLGITAEEAVLLLS